MQISDSKLEATLVSMAGTLFYLREMAATLVRKPVVPKAVASVMFATESELAVLGTQFEATRLAAAADAQPFLDEWLLRTGLQVGGVFRGDTARTFGPGLPLHVTGGIEAARLHNHLVSGIRVVDITLADARIVVPAGVVACIADIPACEQSDFNLVALKDIEVRDQVAGAATKVLHVRVPIQASERRAWASSGNLRM